MTMEGQDDRYAPLELGTVTPSSSAADPGDHVPGNEFGQPTWHRWVGLGAALVVGAVVGIVVNNARDDAAEYSAAELVGGLVEPQTSRRSSSGPASLLVIHLINTGPRDLDVVGVDVTGFVTTADGQPRDPVTAEPDRWVSVQVTADADCDIRPSGDLRVHVRTESGEQTAEITSPAAESGLVWAWHAECESVSGTALSIGETRTISSDATSVETSLPITNGGEDPVQIVSVESATPGFAAESAILPIEVDERGFGAAQVTWTVDECTAAAGITEATVAFNVVNGARETRVLQPLDSRALVELVRLAVRGCET